MHIETTSLADGAYEPIQEPDGDISEVQVNNEDTSQVQVNITEDNEDLNMNPEFKSELHEVQSTLWN